MKKMNPNEHTDVTNNMTYKELKNNNQIMMNNNQPKYENANYIDNQFHNLNETYPNKTKPHHHLNLEHKYSDNNAHIYDQNMGKNIIYNNAQNNNDDYLAKTAEAKTETYIIDPQTGSKIYIDESTNYIGEKYKSKSHPVGVNIDNHIYEEIYLNDPNLKLETQNQENLSPILEYLDIDATINPMEEYGNNEKIEIKNKEKAKLTASALSVSVLSKMDYKSYPTAKHSIGQIGNIVGFGVNSYNGKVKKNNEDRIKIVASHIAQSKINPEKKFHVSYFSIFDGHAGKKCSDFLRAHFFDYLISSQFFPDYPIKAINDSFKKAESQFFKMAVDTKTKTLLDKSGSCALIMLIIDNTLYSVNLGDSRALYSFDTGKWLLQITRDHKPNDEIEKQRIESVGGSIYYANSVTRNGKEILLKEEDFGENFTFPYRVKPGGLAVNHNYIYNIYFLMKYRLPEL